MALLTLAAFSIAFGVLILLVFKATSNPRALQATRRMLRSHLLAIRLFSDDPLLVLRSQARLFVWTARYIALLLPALVIIGILLGFAWDHLDAIWGRVPFAPGAVVLLTARLNGNTAPLRLVTPNWLPVESPPVHVEAEHEVSWRLRVSRAGLGTVAVIAGSEHASKQIDTRPGLHYLVERELAKGGPILWLEMRYPRSGFNWPLWFFLISALTVLAFRRRVGLTL